MAPAVLGGELGRVDPYNVPDLLEAAVAEGDVRACDQLVIGVAVDVAHELSVLGSAQGAHLQDVEAGPGVE